jgi:hypothetical protein
MKRSIVLLVWSLLSVSLAGADKTPVWLTMVSDNKKVGATVTAAATEEFRKHTDFEGSQKLPLATLFLYVNQDVNDTKNPDGWSIAIAHAENVESLTLASRLIDSRDETAKALKPVLITIINKPGFLAHLSVAHLDEMSDEKVKKEDRGLPAAAPMSRHVEFLTFERLTGGGTRT